YGALSVPSGKVAISWRLLDGRRRLELPWLERGGPAVAPGGARGFGTTLIERVVRFDLDGEAELAFAPEGVRCVLAFVLSAGSSPVDLP
ncbi:hypothetical protein ABTF50_20065, partial [Acinetobacter baumannii]